MWPNPQETADLATFTEEILNGKLHFLGSLLDPVEDLWRNVFGKTVNSFQLPRHVFKDVCFKDFSKNFFYGNWLWLNYFSVGLQLYCYKKIPLCGHMWFLGIFQIFLTSRSIKYWFKGTASCHRKKLASPFRSKWTKPNGVNVIKSFGFIKREGTNLTYKDVFRTLSNI